FGTLFMLILLMLFLFADLNSALSMVEIIGMAITKRNNEKRKKTTWITGFCIFLAGIPAALSFGLLGDFTVFDKTMFDLSDYLVSNILMPIGALSIAIFTGFVIPRKVLVEEISKGSKLGKKIFAVWFLIIKYVVPIAIIMVFLDVIGVLKF